MKITATVVLAVVFLAGPLCGQRLPRTRSRFSVAEAEAAATAEAESLRTKIKSKQSLAKSTSTGSTPAAPSTNASSPTPSTDMAPASPSPSPLPPPPSPPASMPSNSSLMMPKLDAEESNSTMQVSSMSTGSPSPSSSIPPPVSLVQVRMAFAPAPSSAASQASKKLMEDKIVAKAMMEESSKNDSVGVKAKKSSEAQEPTKKSTSTTTATPLTTTTSKPVNSSSKSDQSEQEDEVRDVLKRIHQEVFKHPRAQDTKTKNGNSKTNTSDSSSTKKPKENGGLETAETTYVRPSMVHHSKEKDSSSLDAQPSIQSTKFVIRDQGLQQLPSFVRSKERARPSSANTVRHFLVQKQQPLIPQQQQQLQYQQRQQARAQLTDPIDEEAITSTTTSTTSYPIIPIVHFDKEQSADGSYKTSYETANNIFAEETGFLKDNPNQGLGLEDEDQGALLVQQGSYSYTAPDGSLISVTYTADEMGFRAAGSHLPTPPPVPPEIQRSLDIIYAQIQRDEEEAAREAELERQGEASEKHEEKLSPPTTGSKRESRRYLPNTDDNR